MKIANRPLNSISLSVVFFLNLVFAQASSYGQVALSSIPQALDGVVEVCAGSTVLFVNDTEGSMLQGVTAYNWSVPGITVGSEVAGPVSARFDVPGTYTVSLGMITSGGEDDLGSATLTIEVSGEPPLVPQLVSGNSCTQADTLQLFTDVVVFQTQSGTSLCTCAPSSWGPLVTLAGTDQYPVGTVSNIYWGGPGSAVNGGTATFTTQTGFPTVTEDLAFYPGQTSPAGHYSNQGSYNLMHVVEFPSGCTYSDYYVVSWGAALIDQCGGMAQAVCAPSEYQLCFDSQAPGTTYNIDWGDGSPIEQYTYPNLPILPNSVGHAYDESCSNAEDEATAYTITIEAENACTNLTTVNSQGPFVVSTSPEPGFAMELTAPLCEPQAIQFTDTSITGFEAGWGGCFDEYFRAWTINGSSALSGPGYAVQNGGLGDAFWFDPGTEMLDVLFTLPGTYEVALTVSNAFCDPLTATHQVAVAPSQTWDDQTVTICSGDSLDFVPSGWEEGGELAWAAEDNPDIMGEEGGSGPSVSAVLMNTSSSTQTVTYTVTPVNAIGCGAEPFSLTIQVLPLESVSILEPLTDVAVCTGEAVVLTAVLEPEELVDSVQWHWDSNDIEIFGAYVSASDDLSIEFTSDQSSGIWGYYEVFGSGVCGSVVSNSVNVNWLDAPQGEVEGNLALCPGEEAALITWQGGWGSHAFQWYSATDTLGPWQSIEGSNEGFYHPGTPDVTTYYKVWVESMVNNINAPLTACGIFSNIVEVEVVEPQFPQVFVFGGQEVCEGEPFSPISILSDWSVPETDIDWGWEYRELTDETWTAVTESSGLALTPASTNIDRWFRPVATELVTGQHCTLTYDSVEVLVNAIELADLEEFMAGCPGDEDSTLSLDVLADGALSAFWQSAPNEDGPWSFVGNGLELPPEGLFEDTLYFRCVVTSMGVSTFCQSISNVAMTAPLPADALGVCGGSCLYDLDQNGVCDQQQTTGCTDMAACNFISGAVVSDGSCVYPEFGLNCDGSCLLDTDGDGICEQDEVPGCSDINALNFNPDATDEAECFFGSSCSGDLDGDNTIGIGDLLELLSQYGALCD